jgi:poly-beta-1,6-N-acetyl-D-glucosamine synthase
MTALSHEAFLGAFQGAFHGTLGDWLMAAGAGCLFMVLVIYPVLLAIVGWVFRLLVQDDLAVKPDQNKDILAPEVCAIVAFRGWNALAAEKLQNFAELAYPQDRLKVIFVSDGPLEGEAPPMKNFEGRGWLLLEDKAAAGKNSALNVGVGMASGDLLLFTDLDARLRKDALSVIAEHFSDPSIGGVCGLRVPTEKGDPLENVQSQYISWDSWIKKQESNLGFLTSNDGKIYAIRRELFQPVPNAVTDDLFQGLSILRQSRKMVFEPAAKAFIPKPSRSIRHEVARRRRIVARSLYGLFLNRAILNIFRHGVISLGVFVNKIMRRLIPVFLTLMVLGAAMSVHENWVAKVILAGALVLCGAAVLAIKPIIFCLPKFCRRYLVFAQYVLAGTLGTLIGGWDFIRGRRVSRWESVKTDNSVV